jgi:2-polyprenyl-3-methyl-5-hydroxy-6-metoxy-1,4-benzoquinol methylase
MGKNSIDKYWNTYQNIYGFEEVLKKYRHRVAIEFLKDLQPRKILEIGCGFNPMFIDYGDFDSYTVVEPGIAPFKHTVQQKKDDVRINCINNFAENEITNLIDNEYDCIILPGVLHEVDNPYKFLNYLGKLCSKETTLYINVPNANSLHRLIAVEMGLIQDIFTHTERNQILEQTVIFNKDTLIEIVESSIVGMKMVEYASFFIKPFTHEQMDLCLKSRIISNEVIEALFLISNCLPDFGSEIKSVFKMSS